MVFLIPSVNKFSATLPASNTAFAALFAIFCVVTCGSSSTISSPAFSFFSFSSAAESFSSAAFLAEAAAEIAASLIFFRPFNTSSFTSLIISTTAEITSVNRLLGFLAHLASLDATPPLNP